MALAAATIRGASSRAGGGMASRKAASLPIPSVAIGFRPEFLDFKRGIRVGNLEENERITRILKLALEAQHGQPFVTERWRKLEITDVGIMRLALQQEIARSEESRYDHRLHGVLLVSHGISLESPGEIAPARRPDGA
ncbi:MAG: hypothetical protein LAN62_14240 [Acidobacteriia bacterium]|nr:hypothetical protein [Terriglobia bacterium]